MDTQTMLERLSERFDKIYTRDQGITDRHQSIQAAIEWSYILLTEDEKALFRRLSVFSGGFDLKAVEGVCANESLPEETILDLLSRLIDSSMVQTTSMTEGQMRYKLLETLRQYTRKLVIENDEVHGISTRHLEYFTSLAEQAFEERLIAQQYWMVELDKEHDNIISALNWSEKNSPDDFVRLSGALGWFWRFHSHIAMGCDFLERAMAANATPTEIYARVLHSLGSILSLTENITRAIELMNDSLDIWQKYGKD